MVYLTMLSAAHTTGCQSTGWLKNNEFKRSGRKQPRLNLMHYPNIFLE